MSSIGRFHFKNLVAIIGLWVFSTVPSLAQTYPEGPANCEVMLRIGSKDSGSAFPDREIWANHPIIRLIKVSSLRYLGLDVMRELGDAFEGTVVAGIVNPDGSSSIAEFFLDLSRREDRDRIVSEMEYFVDGLQEYYSENESYPKDVETFEEEYSYYSFPTSSEAVISYRPTQDGANFRLECVFEESSALSKFGPAPYFDKDGGNNTQAAKPQVPLNFVVAAKIDNMATLKRLMSGVLGEPVNGFWKESSQTGGVLATVRGDWLLIGDQMSNLGPFLKAVKGEAPGVSTRSSYKLVRRNIDTDAPIVFYADAGSLVRGIPELRNNAQAKILDLIGPIGYAVTPYERSQIRFELFVGVNAPEGSSLATYLEATKGNTPESAFETSNVPWDVSNLLALDFKAAKELLEASLDLYPETRESFDSYQDMFAGMLGLEIEKGFDELFEGPVLVSFEQIDFLTSGIDTFTRVMDGDPESPGESIPPIPFTFAVKVPDNDSRSALIKKMEPYLGSKIRTDRAAGVDITIREDGYLALAEDGPWLYASGSNTDRLMRAMLKAAHGRKKTLSTLDSWARFRLRGRGRMIAFGHQKVDHFYSIVKGFLLYLGADFRPLAEELGGLRDSHSVMTAVPDGFLFLGSIVQGEGE